MSIKSIAALLVAFGAGIGAAPMASAMPVLQDDLEIYGTFRLSIDYGRSDLGKVPENESVGMVDSAFSLSSNTSLIGFRGRRSINDQYVFIWQVEQNVDPDSPRNRGIGNRNTFAGFETPAGVFRFGLYDTPYKLNGIFFSRYTTTIADPQAIIGHGGRSGARLSLRAKNSIRWDKSLLDNRLKLALQYGAGQQDTPGVADNNDTDVWSGSARWTSNGLSVGVAYADWSKLYNDSDVEALSGGVSYRAGLIEFGVLYDHLKADSIDYLNRDAFGGFITYDLTRSLNIGAQWMHADESDVGNDEADQYSVVGTWKVNKELSFYIAATTTINEENAEYIVGDFGHGDHINTVPGGDPSAASIGMAYKF